MVRLSLASELMKKWGQAPRGSREAVVTPLVDRSQSPFLHKLSLLVLLLTTAISSARAEDWPEFRGPTGQGISQSKGLPAVWSRTKNVTWRIAIPGKGWSSPVVVAGRIYMTTAVARGTKDSRDRWLQALCLDAKTGRTIWNVKVFRQDAATTQAIQPKNSHASPTPIVGGKQLFVHFGTQGTACLDLSGKVLWRTRELKYLPEHGNGGSPALVDGVLVISCDGTDTQFVVALDRNSGAIRWKKPRRVVSDRQWSFSTPLAFTAAGRKQVVSGATDSLSSFDPATGEEIWKVLYTGNVAIETRPLFAHGLLYICTGWNRPSLWAVKPDGRGDVTKTHIVWKTSTSVPYTPSPLIVGEELYMVSDAGVATCLDAKSGKQHWRRRLGGNYSASPVYADGKIYFQSEQGDGIVLAAGNIYRQLAKNRLQERTLASYAIADGALFLRSETHLYRIESR